MTDTFKALMLEQFEGETRPWITMLNAEVTGRIVVKWTDASALKKAIRSHPSTEP